MARLLLLTPQIPYPPRQGTALRNWGLLRGLARHHRVSLLTFAAPGQGTALDPTLTECLEHVAVIPQPQRSTAQRLRALLTDLRPDLALRLASTAFREQLIRWLTDTAFDWVQVEGIEMTSYLDSITAATQHPPRIIFDAHNCEYLLQRRAFLGDLRRPTRWPAAGYSFIQWRRLRRYERAICRRAAITLAVSTADAAALRQLAPELNPLVIPNGIWFSEYAGFTESTSAPGQEPLEQPAFVFTGTLDFRPNVDGVIWFVEQVWPRVRAVLPGAHFYAVGQRPHPRLDKLRRHPGIHITGPVADTRPYIRSAMAYVVPLWVGGGTRLKILEASALGQAIVSTTLGAEGFPNVAAALHLANSAPDFAAACIRLAQDPALRADYGARAQRFAAAYDWDQLLPPFLMRL